MWIEKVDDSFEGHQGSKAERIRKSTAIKKIARPRGKRSQNIVRYNYFG